MKGLRIAVMLALVFVVSAPLFAAPPEQTIDPSALEYPAHEAFLCGDTWGCPVCLANMSRTNSMCGRLYMGNGVCKCANPKPMPSPGSAPICGTEYGTCKFLF